MSLDVRLLTNTGGSKYIFRIRNAGVTPVVVHYYNSVADVPKDIRHYAETAKPQAVNYELSKMYGAEKYLYAERRG